MTSLDHLVDILYDRLFVHDVPDQDDKTVIRKLLHRQFNGLRRIVAEKLSQEQTGMNNVRYKHACIQILEDFDTYKKGKP